MVPYEVANVKERVTVVRVVRCVEPWGSYAIYPDMFGWGGCVRDWYGNPRRDIYVRFAAEGEPDRTPEVALEEAERAADEALSKLRAEYEDYCAQRIHKR